MSVKRLAVTLSGGGSLGAYEAGVLYEVIEALRVHNRMAEQDSNYVPIKLDVFTGASAGAMTSSIAVHKLLYDGDSLRGPDTNAFYDYWVVRAHMFPEELEGKLENGMVPTHSPAYSLLNNERFREMLTDKLISRYSQGPNIPAASPHIAAADSISFALALSNLTGMDYSIEYSWPNSKSFTYTRYQDEFVSPGTGAGQDSIEFWQAVRDRAVASGAFPFLLRCQGLERSKSEYQQICGAGNGTIVWPEKDSDPASLAFLDGGMFHNQPLGLARCLGYNIDRSIKDPAEKAARYFLYISPFEKNSKISSKPFQAEDATYFPLAAQMLYAIYNQAQYQDWIEQEKRNRDLMYFSQFEQAFMQSCTQNNAAAKALLQSLAKFLAVDKSKLSMGLASSVASNEDPGTAILRLLREATGITESDYMNIYGLTPGDYKLAGGGLLTFKGFFARRYREHDYAVGRLRAREWLDFVQTDSNLGPIYRHPAPPSVPEVLAKQDLALTEIEQESVGKALGSWAETLLKLEDMTSNE